MAQHCPIEGFTQKLFAKIKEGITKDMTNPYIGGSLKYEKLENIVGKQNIEDYKENPNDQVYMTNRYIGKGIIFGSDKGDFEIHYDTKTKQLLNIYLIA